MNRQRRKQMPLDRTILTQFNVTVADIHLRSRALHGSIAQRVSAESQYIKGDAVASNDAPFRIDNIETAILVHGFEAFTLTIQYAGGQLVDVPCTGLFVLYGKLDYVEVKAPTATRFTYVKS